MGTLLLVTAASGTRKAGAFSADIGNLWIRGRCTGGEVTLHLDPLIALPIPCGDLPFENRITLRRRHQITLSVSAPQATIWGLRVEQVPGNHIYPPRRLS